MRDVALLLGQAQFGVPWSLARTRLGRVGRPQGAIRDFLVGALLRVERAWGRLASSGRGGNYLGHISAGHIVAIVGRHHGEHGGREKKL